VARAEEGLRRHCVTERFLVDVLGISWSAVHEQARTFERGLTPLLAERIDERVGHPSTCPHGNAVPRPSLNAATYLNDNNAVSLREAPVGQPVQVLAISETAEQTAEWLRQCEKAGVRPGAPVLVYSRTGRDVQLETAGRGEPVSLENALAAHVWVVTAPT
jgi:DtxR family Mn-dependent transcriptional regulator